MQKTSTQSTYYFEIALSVLNDLGRRLYRSFTTVLGEAISNSWDADACHVQIFIDTASNSMCVKDDGSGMTADDFQNKFLRIGYSKRNERSKSEERDRPFIGRKGIGKLALLSCARKISIMTRVSGGDYVGGVIDNSGLDKAITENLRPQEYPLEPCRIESFGGWAKDHNRGTLLLFEDINEGIIHSLAFLKKVIALYFRFALIDDTFRISLNGEPINVNCLDDLAGRTEFLWSINDIEDPYVRRLLKIFNHTRNESKKLTVTGAITIKGFIASVQKPRDLKITTTDERVSVDLFVNGRLREKDILKHMPTARVVESYLYGQIHCDGLDDETDRFTSSREGMVANDPKFRKLVSLLKEKVLPTVLEDWDEWRRRHKKDGDPDNPTITPTQRKAEELFNAVSEEYALPEDTRSKEKVESWVMALSEDARFNFASYAECFLSENLVRKYIEENKIALSPEAEAEFKKWKGREDENKQKGNVNIPLRRANSKLSYLDMDALSNLVDKRDRAKEACLPRDASEYKPIRDAVAHTALLTQEAKDKLNSVYLNIKARVRDLLAGFGTRKGEMVESHSVRRSVWWRGRNGRQW